MNKCAILIVNWNSWELLDRCLIALGEQTCQDFDIFVGDNHSEKLISQDMQKTFPQINFIFFSENYGFAGGNNKLLDLVTGQAWVVLLNPDAFPEQDWLEKLLNAANRYPQYSFFSSRLLVASDTSILDGDGDAYHISGRAWRSGHGQNVDVDSKVTYREVFSPCAAAAMYRIDIIKAIGGFDEDFFCYFEDVDLAFRLRLHGHRCLAVTDSLVHHVGSATSGGQWSDFSVYYGHRNLVWTFVKNMPGILFYVFLPLHVCLNIFSVLMLVLRGQGSVGIRAKKDAIKGLSLIWEKRRKIQAGRVCTIAALFKVMSKQLLPWKRTN